MVAEGYRVGIIIIMIIMIIIIIMNWIF